MCNKGDLESPRSLPQTPHHSVPACGQHVLWPDVASRSLAPLLLSLSGGMLMVPCHAVAVGRELKSACLIELQEPQISGAKPGISSQHGWLFAPCPRHERRKAQRWKARTR